MGRKVGISQPSPERVEAQSHDKGELRDMQAEIYRRGYFMDRDEQNAVDGSILHEHNECKRRLVSLKHEASRIADSLSKVATLLRNGPPYSVLPAVGDIEPVRIQNLFRDLHETFERQTNLADKLKALE